MKRVPHLLPSGVVLLLQSALNSGVVHGDGDLLMVTRGDGLSDGVLKDPAVLLPSETTEDWREPNTATNYHSTCTDN